MKETIVKKSVVLLTLVVFFLFGVFRLLRGKMLDGVSLNKGQKV